MISWTERNTTDRPLLIGVAFFILNLNESTEKVHGPVQNRRFMPSQEHNKWHKPRVFRHMGDFAEGEGFELS